MTWNKETLKEKGSWQSRKVQAYPVWCWIQLLSWVSSRHLWFIMGTFWVDGDENFLQEFEITKEKFTVNLGIGGFTRYPVHFFRASIFGMWRMSCDESTGNVLSMILGPSKYWDRLQLRHFLYFGSIHMDNIHIFFFHNVGLRNHCWSNKTHIHFDTKLDRAESVQRF